MSDEGPRQFWLRNQEGKVWGPMAASTIHILVGQGAFPGTLQASTDGLKFAMIGRFPDLREGLDEAYWGMSPSEARKVAPGPESAPAGGAAAAAPAMDPAALSPDAPVMDPSALSPDAPAMDPAALSPDAPVMDPSALSPDAPVMDPAALSPDAPVMDPSALSPDAPAPPPPPPAEPEPPEDLPPSGDLAETSPFRLAYLALAGQKTCRITFEAPPAVTISFRRGTPEHVATDDPALEIGAWLVSQGALQPAQRDQAEQAKASFGGSFTAAIFGLGLLDAGAAFPLLAAHAKEAYLQAMARTSGPFSVADGEAPPPDAIPSGTPGGALLTEAVRRLDRAAVEHRLGERLHAPIMRSNASRIAPEDLRLGPQETRALGLFDGVRTPAEIAASSGLDPTTVLQAAFLLGACGIVGFGEPRQPAASGKAATPPPGPPPGAGPPKPDGGKPAAPASGRPPGAAAPKPPPPKAPPPPPKTDWAAEEKRVRALLQLWSKKDDPFRVLELNHHCTDEEVKQAFTRLAKRYHPDHTGGAPDTVASLFRDAFDRVREAHGQLSTASKRREVLNALAEAELAESAGPPVDTASLEKVRHLTKLRRYDDAATVLDEALAVNPGFAGAWAWRAWVKVLRAKDPAAVKKEAISLIQRALQFDAKSGDAHLCAARIAKHYDDDETAAKHEKKARALGVDDPL